MDDIFCPVPLPPILFWISPGEATTGVCAGAFRNYSKETILQFERQGFQL